MKLKQMAAAFGLLLAGLLLAYGISLLAPASARKEKIDSVLRAKVEQTFQLPPGNSVTVTRHEGQYYLLEVHPNAQEGGGGWALVNDAESGLQVIDAGNKSPYETPCTTLSQAGVPTALALYCTEGTDLIDRATGATTTQEVIWKTDDLYRQ